MSMNPDELVSFANTFSNRASGPMVKKKSAAQRRRAKAKSLKNAAYVALGSSAGKKTKNSGGKSTAGSKSTGSGKGMVANKDVVVTKPIVTPANKSINAGAYIIPAKKAAAPSATQVKNSKAATTAIANRSAAYVALGSPKGVKKKAPKAGGLKAGFFTKSTGSTTTGNGPNKLSPSRASSR
jgi:hypothetical protein